MNKDLLWVLSSILWFLGNPVRRTGPTFITRFTHHIFQCVQCVFHSCLDKILFPEYCFQCFAETLFSINIYMCVSLMIKYRVIGQAQWTRGKCRRFSLWRIGPQFSVIADPFWFSLQVNSFVLILRIRPYL